MAKIKGFNLGTGRFTGQDHLTGSVSISIDTLDLERLGQALKGVNLKTQDRAMVIGMNKGMDRSFTLLNGRLKDWTDLRTQTQAAGQMRKRPASSGRWMAAVVAQGPYTRITAENYNARWRRAWPGVRHRAWGRPQMADHAFMTPRLKPAMTRVGSSRYPIVPLFGLSMAREVERHEDTVRTMTQSVMRTVVVPKALDLIRRKLQGVRAQKTLKN